MKKSSLSALLSLAFLLIFSGINFAKTEIVKNEMMSGGKKRSYFLFVPETAAGKDSPAAPLLVLLHGSGRSGKVLVEHWQKLAEKEGIILAGPDSKNTTNWAIPEDGPQFLFDLVEELKSKHPVNQQRVYLFGHSAGAVFGLLMAVLESNYYAAAAVSAGAFLKMYYPLIDEAERKTPIAIFVGTQDPLFPLSVVRATRDVLVEKKFPVELTEIPNLDHNYYSRSEEINDKAWNFLKNHRLEIEQQYKQYLFKSN